MKKIGVILTAITFFAGITISGYAQTQTPEKPKTEPVKKEVAKPQQGQQTPAQPGKVGQKPMKNWTPAQIDSLKKLAKERAEARKAAQEKAAKEGKTPEAKPAPVKEGQKAEPAKKEMKAEPAVKEAKPGEAVKPAHKDHKKVMTKEQAAEKAAVKEAKPVAKPDVKKEAKPAAEEVKK